MLRAFETGPRPSDIDLSSEETIRRFIVNTATLRGVCHETQRQLRSIESLRRYTKKQITRVVKRWR